MKVHVINGSVEPARDQACCEKLAMLISVISPVNWNLRRHAVRSQPQKGFEEFIQK